MFAHDSTVRGSLIPSHQRVAIVQVSDQRAKDGFLPR
jgi:hypothetical protein